MDALFDPYLFVILTGDVRQEDRQGLTWHTVPSANWDKVLYANDVVCVASDTRSMRSFVVSFATGAEGLKNVFGLNKQRLAA